jgi:hypothetical protein
MGIGQLIYHNSRAVLAAWGCPCYVKFICPFFSSQVSITLIATGFKRQDEPEDRTTKVILVE